MRSELILYQTEDGLARIQLRALDGTVWLSQVEIAELFATTKQNVSLHAKNILAEQELRTEATVKESLTVQNEGARKVRRSTLLYSVPMILAIGYRVRSPRGTQFRQWATAHLNEYLVKGFVMDDERLKNPGGWDHFDELLARIREIRASEKRFYQKVRDFSHSVPTTASMTPERSCSSQRSRTSCFTPSRSRPRRKSWSPVPTPTRPTWRSAPGAARACEGTM